MNHTTLDARQIELVQTSFATLARMADTAAKLFYDRLFEIAPEVRPLFRNDMQEQGRKAMVTLAFIVGSLRNLDAILPAVQSMAIKHVTYGVSAAHYRQLGEALDWVLAEGLGHQFTPEVRAAWSATYEVLANAMISAAYGRQAAA